MYTLDEFIARLADLRDVAGRGDICGVSRVDHLRPGNGGAAKRTTRAGHKSGADYDIRIPRVGYSGVRHPARPATYERH